MIASDGARDTWRRAAINEARALCVEKQAIIGRYSPRSSPFPFAIDSVPKKRDSVESSDEEKKSSPLDPLAEQESASLLAERWKK